MAEKNQGINRRKFVYSASAAAFTASIAGCGGIGNDGGDTPTEGESQEGVPDEIPPQWWAPFEEEYFSDTETVEKTEEMLDQHGPEHTAVRGQPLDPIFIAFGNDDETWMREHALAVQQSFMELGVPSELDEMPVSVLYDENWRDDVGLATTISMNTHGPDPQRGLDPNPFLDRAHPSNPSNSMNYWNDEASELIEEQIKEIEDQERRIELVHEAQDILSEDMYLQTTGFADAISVMNTNEFTGWVGTPGNGHTQDSFIWSNVNVQPQTDETTLVKGVSQEMENLNISYGAGDWKAKVLTNVYDGLMDASPDFDLVPGLATNMEAVDDTTVEVDLREGVTWHDGESFGPEDVKFSAEYYAETNSTQQPAFYDPIDSVEILSETGGGSVRFNLIEPDAGFLTYRAVRSIIYAKHYWENVDDPVNHNPDPAIGTGPFRVESWEPGQRLVLSKWEDHWLWDEDIRREQIGDQFEPGDGVDEIRYVNVGNTDSLIGALQDGSIDCIGEGLTNPQADRAAESDGVEKKTQENYAALDIHINHCVALIRDKEFRHAWAMSFDKEGFFENTLGGNGTVQPTGGNNLAPIIGDWYNPDAHQFDFDVEEARSRLEKAGYTWDNEGTLRWPNGEAWAAFHERIQQENTSKTREDLGQPDFS